MKFLYLKATLDETPLDRTKANTLLRQLVDEAVIDYTTGQLDLIWKHGGESYAIIGFPEEEHEG